MVGWPMGDARPLTLASSLQNPMLQACFSNSCEHSSSSTCGPPYYNTCSIMLQKPSAALASSITNVIIAYDPAWHNIRTNDMGGTRLSCTPAAGSYAMRERERELTHEGSRRLTLINLGRTLATTCLKAQSYQPWPTTATRTTKAAPNNNPTLSRHKT
jgi:hypothetical protein